MKWLIAGFANAALVILAVGTAAIQVENLRCRANIERLERASRAREMELMRQRQRVQDGTSLEQLAQRWRELLAKVAPT